MKHIERSGALLPSEFIDRDLLKEQRKQLLDEKVTSGTGEKANNSSAGELTILSTSSVIHSHLTPGSKFVKAMTLTMPFVAFSERMPRTKSLSPGTGAERKH
jgi:hypothetical protein